MKEAEETLSNIVKDYHKTDVFMRINMFWLALAYFYILWKVIDTLLLS